MKATTIPGDDVLAAHERAALEIGELRRKGVPCHLEEHADPSGHHIEVVRGAPGASGKAASEQAQELPRT